MTNEVRSYYDGNAQRELERHNHLRMEYEITRRALGQYLPPAPSSILDVGGGPGRYAIDLARRGYAVTLGDISTSELGLASQEAAREGVSLEGVMELDARDMSAFADSSFDAVLMMGPLYHLLDEGDRRSAVREAARVLKPGGVLFAAFITRYAVLRFWARYDPARVTAEPERFLRQLESGRVTDNAGFTDVYTVHPQDIEPLMAASSFTTVDLIGCEGVVGLIQDQIDKLADEGRQWWCDVNYRLSRDPSTHGTSDHLLYIGRKG